MADFADALEEKSSRKSLKRDSKKAAKDWCDGDGSRGIPSTRIAGFFHPSNTHLHGFKREIDFLGGVLTGVKLSFKIFEWFRFPYSCDEGFPPNCTLHHLHSLVKASDASVKLDIYPHLSYNFSKTDQLFEYVFVHPDRKVISRDELHVGREEPLPFRSNDYPRRVTKTSNLPKLRPEYAKSEWVHPGAARASSYDREDCDVTVRDIRLVTSQRRRHVEWFNRRWKSHYQLWWRILLDLEPADKVARRVAAPGQRGETKEGDKYDSTATSELMCTSIRVCAHLLAFGAVNGALDPAVLMKGVELLKIPRPPCSVPLVPVLIDEADESAVAKIEEIHRRRAEKEEKKRERKRNEKQKTIQLKRNQEG